MSLERITAIRSKLERLPEFIPQAIAETLRELAPVIEDLLAAQLQRGEKGDGSSLPDYSPVSIAKYGKPPGPIRLFDTGAFYRGMTLKVGTDSFEIDDSDLKTPKLTEFYGDNILQLSPDSLQVLKDDYLIEEVNIKVKKFLEI